MERELYPGFFADAIRNKLETYHLPIRLWRKMKGRKNEKEVIDDQSEKTS